MLDNVLRIKCLAVGTPSATGDSLTPLSEIVALGTGPRRINPDPFRIATPDARIR